jgi:hypothetical protein
MGWLQVTLLGDPQQQVGGKGRRILQDWVWTRQLCSSPSICTGPAQALLQSYWVLYWPRGPYLSREHQLWYLLPRRSHVAEDKGNSTDENTELTHEAQGQSHG